jgi:50S ribosomal subunit-associated GTPase HflX
MLDRYLVLIETSDLDAVIVANKVDLVGEAEAHRLFAPYERLEYPVIYTSAVTGYGIDALRCATRRTDQRGHGAVRGRGRAVCSMPCNQGWGWRSAPSALR